jgi:hypothetical protein
MLTIETRRRLTTILVGAAAAAQAALEHPPDSQAWHPVEDALVQAWLTAFGNVASEPPAFAEGCGKSEWPKAR